MESNVVSVDRSRLEFVGQLVEVKWSSSHAFAKKQCEQCVYAVRGHENDMICLELVYDAVDGAHGKDAVYWVNVLSVQYLRVLGEREAQSRITFYEREFQLDRPHD
jgi:hypothetical protein